jgi:hypothetical protein
MKKQIASPLSLLQGSGLRQRGLERRVGAAPWHLVLLCLKESSTERLHT